MRITMNSNTNRPATLEDYISLAKANLRNSKWWGQCENGWAHGPSNRPIATILIADEYYRSYADSLADDVAYGIKICKGCFRHMVSLGQSTDVLCRRTPISLAKRNECRAEILDEHGEVSKLCTRAGAHFILFNDKRIWKCANHIKPYLKAGFETFRVRQNGRVRCTTEELWDLFGF